MSLGALVLGRAMGVMPAASQAIAISSTSLAEMLPCSQSMSTQSNPAHPNISTICGEGNMTEQPRAGSPRAILSFMRLGFMAARLLLKKQSSMRDRTGDRPWMRHASATSAPPATGGALERGRDEAWQVERVLPSAQQSFLVAGIGMPHHAARWIVPQHASETPCRGLGAIAHDHHAGVLRVADADTAPVVDRHPGGTGGAIEERVEERPVRYRVRPVAHGLCFAVGACYRARIQMIAADHDRCGEFALGHHGVEGEPQPVPITQPQPADACRQALEGNARSGHVEPMMQVRTVGHQLFHLGIGAVDVLWI